MSSLLVFNRVHRLEIQSVMLVFSTPSAPPTFSLVHLPSPPFPVWISIGVCIHTVCNRGGGGDRGPQTDKHLPPSILTGQNLGFGVFIDIWFMVFHKYTCTSGLYPPPPPPWRVDGKASNWWCVYYAETGEPGLMKSDSEPRTKHCTKSVNRFASSQLPRGWFCVLFLFLFCLYSVQAARAFWLWLRLHLIIWKV